VHYVELDEVSNINSTTTTTTTTNNNNTNKLQKTAISDNVHIVGKY